MCISVCVCVCACLCVCVCAHTCIYSCYIYNRLAHVSHQLWTERQTVTLFNEHPATYTSNAYRVVALHLTYCILVQVNVLCMTV